MIAANIDSGHKSNTNAAGIDEVDRLLLELQRNLEDAKLSLKGRRPVKPKCRLMLKEC